jgi:hypothetical protein
LKQIAVFRYCEQVLQDRAANASRGWLWQVKGKVATYCRKTLENRIDEDRPAAPCDEGLSELERRQIVRCHPLLCDDSPGGAPQHVSPDWLVGLRLRVARFMASLRESGTSQP